MLNLQKKITQIDHHNNANFVTKFACYQLACIETIKCIGRAVRPPKPVKGINGII